MSLDRLRSELAEQDDREGEPHGPPGASSMHRVAKRLGLISLSLGIAVGCTERPEHITLRGRVVGHDGQPMAAAYASIQKTGFRERLTPRADGVFEFELGETGAYFLWLAGVHHKTVAIPLYLDALGETEIDVQLAAATYRSPMDSVQVIGDFNDFSTDEGGRWMEPQADGTFVATVPTPADTLAYRLLGVQSGGAPISGTHADRFVWQRGGAMNSGQAGIFFAVLSSELDSVRVTFDPRALPHSQNPERASFAEPESRTARMYALNDEFESRVRRFSRAFQRHRRSGADPRQFKYDWSGDVAEVVAQLEREDDPVVRQFLLLQTFSRLQPSPGDSLIARRVFAEVPPTSMVWSMIWAGPRNAILKVCWLAQQDDAAGAYNRHVIQEHPDPEVRGAFLDYEVSRAHAAMQRERESMLGGELPGATTAEMMFSDLYHRLITEYGETRYAKRAKMMYAPERSIQAGLPIPEFELVSLDDSTVSWTREDFHGRVYLLDFWAVWCGPCVGEMPYLHNAYETYKDRGFTILSLSFDQHPRHVAAFRNDTWRMPWLHTFVPNGFRSTLAERFEVWGIPKQILVDESGTIFSVDVRGDRLLKILADVFGDVPEP